MPVAFDTGTSHIGFRCVRDSIGAGRRQCRNDIFSTSDLSVCIKLQCGEAVQSSLFFWLSGWSFLPPRWTASHVEFFHFCARRRDVKLGKQCAFLERTPVHGISASGFCRVLGYVRSQQEVFPNNSGKTMAVLVGDLYREPMFLTRLKLVTQDGVQFGVDLMGNSLFKGPKWSLLHSPWIWV